MSLMSGQHFRSLYSKYFVKLISKPEIRKLVGVGYSKIKTHVWGNQGTLR